MTDEMRLRLYITVIVIVMATLYVGPPIVSAQLESIRSELHTSCSKEFPALGFEFCLQEAGRKAALPMWMYLLPYFPAGVILWLNWLIKPRLRLAVESYPKRTMKTLLWLGLIVTALVIWYAIWEIFSREEAELHKIEFGVILRMTWIAAGWLIAPLLFHHLTAPTSLATSTRKWMTALILLAATPIIAGILILIREGIRAMNG